MDLTEQLRVLDAAKGDPAKLALATVDLAYPTLEEAERAALRQSLEAAAIPHWCDETMLAALLEIPLDESAAQLSGLNKLTVLEPFRARGENAVNVHEATRLALRQAMATNSLNRFRTLSTRMVALFASDFTPAGRIEWIYHFLCGDPDRGATELAKLFREWTRSANIEDRYALGAALSELEKTHLVEGRARVWTVLYIASLRVDRGEASQLENVGTLALQLAKDAADQTAEADALCLLGDALRAQGKLVEARAAFGKFQDLCARLAELDATNDDRQSDLAVAYNRMGGVLEAQGKLPEAYDAFVKSLTILRTLAEQEPSNAGRRRDLATGQGRIGDILQAQGKLPEAQEAFANCLSMCQQLVQLNPTNAEWQQLLASAHAQVGDVLMDQNKLEDAQREYKDYLEISRRLVEREPTNAGWQLDLAVAQSRVGDVLQVQGKMPEAQEAFVEYLSISRRLAEQDSSNADTRDHLAVAHGRIGVLLETEGKLEEAQVEYEEYLSISHQLVSLDPTSAAWQGRVVNAARLLATLKVKEGKYEEALKLYEEATKVLDALTEGAPGFAQWAQDKKNLEAEIAKCRSLMSDGKKSDQ